MFSLFKRKPKPTAPDVLHSQLLIDVLRQFSDFEQRGLLFIAPLQHRVTVSQQLAALFTQDTDSLQRFFRGLSLYATYELSRLLTNHTLAKLELEAKADKRKALGRELTDEEAAVARMQAFADSDVTDIINKDIYFDIVVVSANSEPVVIARVHDSEVEILSVQE